MQFIWAQMIQNRLSRYIILLLILAFLAFAYIEHQGSQSRNQEIAVLKLRIAGLEKRNELLSTGVTELKEQLSRLETALSRIDKFASERNGGAVLSGQASQFQEFIEPERGVAQRQIKSGLYIVDRPVTIKRARSDSYYKEDFTILPVRRLTLLAGTLLDTLQEHMTPWYFTSILTIAALTDSMSHAHFLLLVQAHLQLACWPRAPTICMSN